MFFSFFFWLFPFLLLCFGFVFLRKCVCLKTQKSGLLKIYIYLFGCTGSTLRHVGPSSLTRDWTRPRGLGAWSLSHWTSREVPGLLSKVPASWLHHAVCLQAVFWYLSDWVWGPVCGHKEIRMFLVCWRRMCVLQLVNALVWICTLHHHYQ